MEEFSIFFVVNKSPHWEFDNFILRISTVHELYTATFTIICGYFFYVAKIRKSINIEVSNDDEITPSPSITSERASFCNAGLTPPGNDSAPSISSSELHINSIDEHIDEFMIITRL
jgi:hypothetical protein